MLKADADLDAGDGERLVNAGDGMDMQIDTNDVEAGAMAMAFDVSLESSDIDAVCACSVNTRIWLARGSRLLSTRQHAAAQCRAPGRCGCSSSAL
eukprot:132288-Chlamydomonas_euryale.AAC.4